MMLKRVAQKKTEINIIPMVDIVFQLIIFFLVATQIKQDESSNIILPTATKSETLKQEQNPPLVVNVVDARQAENAGGRPYVMNRQSLSFKEFQTALESLNRVYTAEGKRPAVRIRGAFDSRFEDVRKALAACVEIGISKVRIATRKVEK